MTKLTKCLEVVKGISQEDQDSVLQAFEEYTDAGMTPTEAQVKATQDVLTDLEGQKTGFQELIDKQITKPAEEVAEKEVKAAEEKKAEAQKEVESKLALDR